MTILNRKEPFVLLFGDLIFLSLALWVSLFVRYLSVPDTNLVVSHFIPFSIIFLVWVLVFFIAGLYERQTVIIKSRLSSIILQSQIINSLIAVLFFYFIPYFGITPKTNLFIDLVLSLFFVIFWRLFLYNLFTVRNPEKAILVGSGSEMRELEEEANTNPHSAINFVSVIDLSHEHASDFNFEAGISTVVIDLHNTKTEPLLPHFYNLIFSRVQFVDIHSIYEDIFNRIPLSLVKYSWFLENISNSPNVFYDGLKRLMDIVIALPVGVVSLVFYPFVVLAIKLDDGGPVFYKQDRVGKDNKIISITKFRTMTTKVDIDFANDSGSRVTRVGSFLRKSRLDEIPQIWSVIKGDQSLIGPRPEVPALVKSYEEQIPYYAVRHIIKPGPDPQLA